ncbi:MAG TPA: ABC transporter substrate-binding protein [Actinocrinis sp.]|jgi:osmoprotectant transport system substrate-binding protein
MTTPLLRRLAAPAAALLAAAALAGCSSSNSGNPLAGSQPTGSIVVGSDNFAESVLLADVYGQALAAKGYKVSYKLDIGSREVTYGLVKSGSITLKPEYNGALLSYLDTLRKKNTPQTSASEVDAAVAQELDPGLEVLNPSTAQDNDTLTLSKSEASALHLTQGATISRFITALNGQPITIGSSPEFQTRYQGLLGLEQAYGLKDSQITYKSLDAGGPLTEAALTSGQVQAGDLFTTDPTIKQGGLLTLVDNKGIFGVQDVLPLVSKKNLGSAGVDALNAVDAKLTSAGLLDMDTKVQVDKDDPATVAKQWLSSEGLG